jgi:chromosome partitioning protein
MDGYDSTPSRSDARAKMADVKDRAKKEAAAVLADMPRFTLMNAMTVFRAAFNNCSGEGLAVSEMSSRDPKACAEISFVHQELFGGR